MEWLRLYTEITWDRKLRRHSPAVRWAWVTVLCIARRSPNPGCLLLGEDVPATVADIADEAAISLEEVNESLKIFKEQNMLSEDEDGIFCLVHWGNRQRESDDSSERVRKYRDKQKAKRECNVTVTTPDTDTEADTELDTEKDKEVAPADLTPTEKEILHLLKSTPNYPFDWPKDIENIRSLITDYPQLNLISEIKKWCAYKRDKPLKKKSNPRLQLRNWMENSVKWLKEKGDPSNATSGRDSPRTDHANTESGEEFQSRFAGLSTKVSAMS